MKKTKKRTTKVKKKVVRLKKKKAVKKKTVKKKIKRRVSKLKKTVKRTAKKKRAKNAKKTRRRKKKISMEDIYSILNKVQIGKKKVIFASHMVDAPTIENNIKDVDLVYRKVEMKTQVVFTVYPNNTQYDEDHMIKLEIMDDEIPDVDQIFG